jgi:hypothetical protein
MVSEMGMIIMPPCICCGKEIDNAGPDPATATSPPSGAISFSASGNYGSAIFDPMPSEGRVFLEINLCDECAVSRASRIRMCKSVAAPRHYEVVQQPWNPNA